MFLNAVIKWSWNFIVYRVQEPKQVEVQHRPFFVPYVTVNSPQPRINFSHASNVVYKDSTYESFPFPVSCNQFKCLQLTQTFEQCLEYSLQNMMTAQWIIKKEGNSLVKRSLHSLVSFKSFCYDIDTRANYTFWFGSLKQHLELCLRVNGWRSQSDV